MNQIENEVLPFPGLNKNEIQCGTKVFYSLMLHLNEEATVVLETNNRLKANEIEYLGVKFKLNEFIPENSVITSDPELLGMLTNIKDVIEKNKPKVH